MHIVNRFCTWGQQIPKNVTEKLHQENFEEQVSIFAVISKCPKIKLFKTSAIDYNSQGKGFCERMSLLSPTVL